MAEDMLSFALDYAKRGFAVFPLKQDKTPYISNGFQKATTNEMQIETWWKRWPDANIGIATGQMSGGVCVIDLDIDEEKGKNGLKAMRDWEHNYGTVLKPSCMAITGRGGMHYFFRSSEEVKCRINLLPGVDVRGDGGYIMAPPSLHPNGNRYNGATIYPLMKCQSSQSTTTLNICYITIAMHFKANLPTFRRTGSPKEKETELFSSLLV